MFEPLHELLVWRFSLCWGQFNRFVSEWKTNVYKQKSFVDIEKNGRIMEPITHRDGEYSSER